MWCNEKYPDQEDEKNRLRTIAKDLFDKKVKKCFQTDLSNKSR